jgi:hypothetical protein
MMEKYMTTYSSGSGPDHEAIQLPWDVVEEILGGPHMGDADDDGALAQWILDNGGPEWAWTAEGWTDEYGWGLIGPELIN